MDKIKKWGSWILLALVVLVGFFVGRSVWASLQDTRALLQEQEARMQELTDRDTRMRAYTDSLDAVLADLQVREARLAQARDSLDQRLQQVRRQYARALERIDTLWTGGAVLSELDAAFPNWRGQFRQVTRADGVHAMLAPRFFGAEVVEIKTELDQRTRELAIKDSTVTNLEETLAVKDEQVRTASLKADTLQANYDNLWIEYQDLDARYTSIVKRKWYQFRFTPSHLLTAGVGFGAGYAVRSLK